MNKKIKEIPSIDRPREKMLRNGPRALSNLELMAVLVGCGSKAREVLAIASDITRIAEKDFNSLTLEKLTGIQGVGAGKACQIMAAIEYSRRFLVKEEIKVNTSARVLPLLEELRPKKQEHFLSLTVDGANNLITKRTVFIGTLNQSLVHPREIFACALSDRAAGIILAHNHPSGECTPSREDHIVTNRLVEVGRVMGIPILDHIIICKNGYFSFQDRGLVKP